MPQKNTIAWDALEITENAPVLLFETERQQVFWLGIAESTAFRCNAYLIRSLDQAWLVDPGGVLDFEQVRERAACVVSLDSLRGMILCHQDPDVAGSLTLWLREHPKLEVVTSPRARVLLAHDAKDFSYWNIETHPCMKLAQGRELRFVTAPHLHSPAAFVTYDSLSGFLFSGDIWGAMTPEWSLVCKDFEAHREAMDLFHMDYMASHVAALGFVRKLDALSIRAVLPQHGSILPESMVPAALRYLRGLRCGTDILYPDLRS